MRRAVSTICAILACGTAAAEPVNGTYCVRDRQGTRSLFVGVNPDSSLLFGVSNWTANGHHFGVTGTARPTGEGRWRFEDMMASADPTERCAVVMTATKGGGYAVNTVEDARCEAMAGRRAVLHGTLAFPPGSRRGDASVDLAELEKFLNAACTRGARPAPARH